MTTTAAITAILPADATVTSSQATAVSSDGAVAGYETQANGTVQAFIAYNGVVTFLSPTWSYAYAINSAHVAVGTAGSGYPTTEWSSSGVTTTLISASTKGLAYAINNAGTVGGGTVVNGTSQAFILSGGQISWLTSIDPAVTSAEVLGLNNENAAVGSFSTGNPYIGHAFLWQNGTMTDLGVSYVGSTSATAINDEGLIVGYADSTAVYWQNGAMTFLGTLPGYQTSFAHAVNNSGLIVGEGFDGYGDHHALMWQNGKIVDLNTLLPANSGWVVEDATGIDDQGQIVGYGLYNGVQTAFELTLNGAQSPVALNSAQAVVQAFQAGQLIAQVNVVDTGLGVATYLDGLEAAAVAGKLSTITLSDANPPILSLTAAQTIKDAAALAKIASAFSLQVNGDGSAVTVAGIAGHTTTVVLALPYADFQLTAIDADTGFKVTGSSAGGAIADEFDLTGAIVFGDGTAAYVGASGITAIRSLGTLSAGTLQPLSISAAGEVIGFAGTAQSPSLETAFYWYDGVITSLAPLSGAQGAEALHINNNGLVVGESYATNSLGGSSTAVYWLTRDILAGDYRPISIGWLPGDFASLAISDNDLGDIVGTSYTTGTTYRGFLFKNGTMTDLGSLGGYLVEPLAINNADLITGKAAIAGGAFHAFQWQNGVMSDLGVLPGGTASTGEAVNASGTIVGYSTNSAGLNQAVSWTGGQLHQLPNLVNSTSSFANAINSAGWIVGESANTTGAVAVLWANGAIYNLNAFLPTGTGWILGDALSINDQGQVSGNGSYDGLNASFEITLPANLVLTASGALLEAVNNQLTGAVNIGDSAAKVAVAIDGLQALASAGELGGITLTDNGIPNVTVTAAQFTADRAALDDISSPHSVTVVMTGTASQYNFSSGTLAGASALQFSDQTVIVAATPGNGPVTTGNVTELYAAVLDREPDLGGLAFYQNYLKANPGTPLLQFAEWFLQSPEYAGNSAHAYAQTTAGDAQFITDSYENLLHRAPTSADIAYYQANVIAPALKGLTPGSQAYTAAELQAHAQMLVYFSASPEFLTDVQITAAHPADAQHWLVLT